MNNMECFQCALKHVSASISYAKQIISGHGKGADLDHRPDFLGELVNLEHHLELLDENLFLQVKNYRADLQSRHVEINQTDIDFLRNLYIQIEAIQQQKPKVEYKKQIDAIPCVLFMHIHDRKYFELCYKKLKENLRDYSKIYYLNSDVDLSGFEVEKVNFEDIEEEYIFVMTERQIILKQQTAKTLLRLAENMNVNQNVDIKSVVLEIKKNQPYYFYDNFPCLVKKIQLAEYKEKNHPLTYICNKYKQQYTLAYHFAINLNKKICCSNRNKMKTDFYCYIANEEALNSVKSYYKID